MAALSALVALEPASVNESMRGPTATWATKAARPTHLGQGFLTLGFRPIELLEVGYGQPFLKLDGAVAHNVSGIHVLLYGLARPVSESSA